MEDSNSLIQKFGYSEMYEWAEVPQREHMLGRFVTFSEDAPDKIVPVSKKEQTPIGVTTVNSICDSDDPEYWRYKNICNEYGDTYLRKERLAVGAKVYDQVNEINFIKTYPWEHFVPIENQYFRKDMKYVKRSNRQEWIRVNLLGKCVVFDNGTCKAGSWCAPYFGKIKELQGSAVPALDSDTNRYYVISRVSDKTILVLNK